VRSLNLVVRRSQVRPSFRFLTASIVLLLAIGCFYFGVEGILDGAVDVPSKLSSRLVARTTSPLAFWFCVLVWVSGGAYLTRVAIVNFREATGRTLRP